MKVGQVDEDLSEMGLPKKGVPLDLAKLVEVLVIAVDQVVFLADRGPVDQLEQEVLVEVDLVEVDQAADLAELEVEVGAVTAADLIDKSQAHSYPLVIL